MGRPLVVTTSRPIIFQSKLLCFSLTYLFLSLFFALYSTLFPIQCFLRSSYQSFTYPKSYGQHKYAIPTTRKSCENPLPFSDYETVVKEVKEICSSSPGSNSGELRYMQGSSGSFNLKMDILKRISYFDHRDVQGEIPCGFLKKFPVSDSDRISMEKCNGLVVVSAVFGDHDKIRQPKALGSKTLDHVCFVMFVDDITLKELQYQKLISGSSREYRIGVWKIVKVSIDQLYKNAAMNGMIPKYLVHRLFPNSKYSIWVDAKMQLVVDPLLLIHSLVISKDVDMAISQHPFFSHTMEDVMATARWKKWGDVSSLREQIETYCEMGLQPWSLKKLPYPSDVPDSALILRKHDLANNLFSCLIFNELEAFNPRDQLSFAFVRDHTYPKLKLNMFDVEVFERVATEYRHVLKQNGLHMAKTERSSSNLFVNNSSCKCDRYLMKMWGESH